VDTQLRQQPISDKRSDNADYPGYFSGRLSFGELMVVVGGFYQVNQSLRWFVDNFALLAEWRAAPTSNSR
jgi:ABC-type uncharacterized transport system fused permease/ATPase subunit